MVTPAEFRIIHRGFYGDCTSCLLPLRAIDGFTGAERFDADSATRKDNMMSQNDLPEVKPDLMVKAWVFVITARGPLAIYAGLVALAMLLASMVAIRLFGH